VDHRHRRGRWGGVGPHEDLLGTLSTSARPGPPMCPGQAAAEGGGEEVAAGGVSSYSDRTDAQGSRLPPSCPRRQDHRSLQKPKDTADTLSGNTPGRSRWTRWPASRTRQGPPDTVLPGHLAASVLGDRDPARP
jgi:hypothetical protein